MRAPTTSRKKEQLLAAAEEIFLKWGYPNTTVDMIVEKSGASKQTLYVYFESKEEIFHAVIEKLKTAAELKIDSSKLLDLNLEHFLTALATTLLKQVQSVEFTRFIWLVSGECGRFPRLRETYIDEFVRPVLEATELYAQRHSETGLKDPEAAAFYFRGAITSFSLYINQGFGFTEDALPSFLNVLVGSFKNKTSHGIEYRSDKHDKKQIPFALKKTTSGKRDQILNAALELFLEKGFRDSAMNEVTSRSSVSKATVYAHFNNKEVLFKALHEQMIGEIEVRLTQDESTTKNSQQFLTTFAENFLRLFDDSIVRDYFRVLFGEPSRLKIYLTEALRILLLTQSEALEAEIAAVAGRNPDAHRYSAAIFTGALFSYSLVQKIYTNADLLALDRERFLNELFGRIALT